MNAEQMKDRTRAFALRVVKLVEALPEARTAAVLGKQLLRCGTAVGANYRAACRARTRKDFIAKLGVVEEECDETMYWIELLVETGIVGADRVAALLKEADELLSIIVATIKKARPE